MKHFEHVFGGLATWVSYPSNSVESVLVAAWVNQDLFERKQKIPPMRIMESYGIMESTNNAMILSETLLWISGSNEQLHFWTNFEPNTARPGPRGRPEDRSLDMEVHRVYTGREWENQWTSAINGYKWGHLLGDISTMWCMDVSENGNVTSNWWQVQYGTWW